MKQLDEQLDKKPTTQAVIDMAELRIRNLLAFEELQSFNDTGKFRYKHPFIAHQSERAQLEDLLIRKSFCGVIKMYSTTSADTNPT